MPLLTIVSPDVKSRLGIRRGKPWMAPGALTEIGEMIPRRHYDVVAWDESVQGPVPDDLINDSHLIALTFLTPSRYRAMDIADRARELGKQVIAGGRDIIGWAREENGMNEIYEYFPSVCTTTLSTDLMGEILIDAANKRLKPHYELPEHEKAQMVLPRRDLIEPNRYFAGYTLRSSEGCKWNCDFCTVGGKGFVKKDQTVLEAELKTVGWFFLDVADSFAGDIDFVMNDVLPLYKKSRKKWGTEINVRDSLREINGKTLIQYMAEAGCRLIYIGIESVTRKLVNNKCDKTLAEKAVLECRRCGVVVIGALILDIFGDETVDEIEEMIVWATKWLDFAQFSLVAALPGCVMRQKALVEGRILLPENWEKYDGAWPTLVHKLSPEELRRMWHRAYTYFSQPEHVFQRAMRTQGILYKIVLLCGGLRYHQEIPAS